MPFRKMKQKKFKGIYEYYRKSDIDKVTTAYYISVRNDKGLPVKVKTDATTAQEAVVALALYKQTRTTKSTNQTTITKKKCTLEELTDIYFSQRKAVDNDREKQKFVKNVFEFVDKQRLASSIKQQDLMHIQDGLKDKEFAPHYVNILVVTVSVIIKWGFRNQYLDKPLPTIQKLEVDNARQRIFSDSELESIYSSVTPKYRFFLRMMYYTAQRPKSILSLQRKDIFADSILIRGIKQGKTHQVPISPKIKEELMEWIKDIGESGYICSQGSKPMSYDGIVYHTKPLFKRLFNKGLDYADINDRMKWASLYTIRHTALSNVYNKTGDIYITQNLANHADPKMTMRYAKINDETKVQAVGVL